jgi:hypothetical protein
MPKLTSKKATRQAKPLKFKLHKRLDRKAALKSLRESHKEIEMISQDMRENKRVSRAVLSREISR